MVQIQLKTFRRGFLSILWVELTQEMKAKSFVIDICVVHLVFATIVVVALRLLLLLLNNTIEISITL
jgi:hypothetical protein